VWLVYNVLHEGFHGLPLFTKLHILLFVVLIGIFQCLL
jgi:hypothetical protein